MFGASTKLRRTIAAADAARDRGAWGEAAVLYRNVLAMAPDRAGLWVQYGHALKESGDVAAAESAYLWAHALAPTHAETLLHVGHTRKLQARPADAVQAYADALRLDPDLRAARDELIHLGAREALPGGGAGGLSRARELVSLTTALDRASDALLAWSAAAPRPVADYAAFRRDYPPPPPPAGATMPIDVVIDATSAAPAQLRSTLLSLIDQSYPHWTASISGSAVLVDHPVASLAAIDHRIRFAGGAERDTDMVLLLDGGTWLDREALAWLAFAAERTGARAIFADHDSILPNWRTGSTRFAPCLFPAFDRHFFAGVAEVPLAILLRRDDLADGVGEDCRRAVLLNAGNGNVAHVPRLLSSRTMLPRSALGGIDDLPPRVAVLPRRSVPRRGSEAISVIIPTRDAPELLRACVQSLIARADAPERLDIVIIDNRSIDPEIDRLVATWRRAGTARVVEFDEPFNWSRANNIGARASRGELLAFVNNDTEMLTQGWDSQLAYDLASDDVGVVGALLLYPDRTMQHGGVVFGIGEGSPVHEGVGASPSDAGPLDRWRTRRAVPAVTGAFLAVRSDVLGEVGGFDELLAIAFNDIDFCMRVRSTGRIILYDPSIELVHHESKTRGFNDTMTRLAWDLAELETFYQHWGDAIFDDLGYNPHWNPAGRPFDGYREPGLSVILNHLDRSARRDPWRVTPAAMTSLTSRATGGGDGPR